MPSGASGDADDGTLGRLRVRAEIDQAVDPAVGALLFSAERLRLNERHGPPLELILVAVGEVARAVDVLRRAMNLEFESGERIFEPAFNQADGKVRYVNSYPLAIELLGRVNGGAAAAKWVKNCIILLRR
jgi:hypothetical protein